MTKGFISNFDLLEEKSNTDDLIGFGDFKEKFVHRIESIFSPSIVSLVGPFGSGKSTMLFQIMKERKAKELWIEFDAWKYPDRDNLWEGFVLDVAKQANPSAFRAIEKELHGKQNDDKKTLVNVLSKIPGAAVLEGLNHFLETSPAKRVEDVHKILENCFQDIKKNVVIVVEDIDRSGDSGIFFLETLKQFLKSKRLENNLVIIVPIANDNYYKNLDSYLKCVDYFEFFDLKHRNLNTFVQTLFDEALFQGEQKRRNGEIAWLGEKRKTQTISFLEGLLEEMPNVTMRLIKLIIRKANVIFMNQKLDGKEPDFRITLCVEASKYFRVDPSETRTYYDLFKIEKYVRINNIFSAYLYSMFANNDSLYTMNYDHTPRKIRIDSKFPFKLIDRVGDDVLSFPSFPWSYTTSQLTQGQAIASFYFEY